MIIGLFVYTLLDTTIYKIRRSIKEEDHSNVIASIQTSIQSTRNNPQSLPDFIYQAVWTYIIASLRSGNLDRAKDLMRQMNEDLLDGISEEVKMYLNGE